MTMGSSILASLGAALHSLQNPYFAHRTGQVPACKSVTALKAFEAELAGRLDQLTRGVGGIGYFNLPWFLDAMAVVEFVHLSIKARVPNLQMPLSERDDKLVEEFMDDSVTLLDICNVLREVISDMERYLMLVQLALHSLDLNEPLDQSKLAGARNILFECVETLKKKEEEVSRQGQQRSKLETCSSMLRRMGEKLRIPYVNDDSRSSALFNAIYASTVTTIFISGVLVAALSVKPSRSLSVARVPNQPLWSAPLLKLQKQVKEEAERRKSEGVVCLLHEIDVSDGIVRELYSLVQKILSEGASSLGIDQDQLRNSVDALTRSSEDLQKGLGTLQQEINEVFQIIVSIRVAILDVLSH